MILAILDREEDFLYGISKYFQERLSKTFDIYSFHQKEALVKFSEDKKKEIQVFLGSVCLSEKEQKQLNVKQAIYLSEGNKAEAGETPVIYKYQPIEGIMKNFLEICQFTKDMGRVSVKGSVRFFGVYSPVGRCGKTSLALVMGQVLAQKQRVIYVNLEEWPGFERIIGGYEGLDISDLIYYIKQGKKELGMYLNGMTVTLNQLKILPPVKKAPDIQEAEAKEIEMLLEEIVSSGEYDIVLVDFGSQIKSTFQVMKRFERVFMPVLKNQVSIAKQEQFFDFLKTSEYAELEEKIKICRLKFLESFEDESVEEMYYGNFGKFVKELLEEEGI